MSWLYTITWIEHGLHHPTQLSTGLVGQTSASIISGASYAPGIRMFQKLCFKFWGVILFRLLTSDRWRSLFLQQHQKEYRNDVRLLDISWYDLMYHMSVKDLPGWPAILGQNDAILVIVCHSQYERLTDWLSFLHALIAELVFLISFGCKTNSFCGVSGAMCIKLPRSHKREIIS